MGVLMKKALPFGVCTTAPDVWQLTKVHSLVAENSCHRCFDADAQDRKANGPRASPGVTHPLPRQLAKGKKPLGTLNSHILGGLWVVMNASISRVRTVIILMRFLITPLRIGPGPPSTSFHLSIQEISYGPQVRAMTFC